MNILVTGSEGFIGRNLISHLRYMQDVNVVGSARSDSKLDLIEKVKDSDFIVHLAGSNRPVHEEEFQTINVDLTEVIASNMGENQVLLFASTTQIINDSPYGSSKKSAEDLIIRYQQENQFDCRILRMPNVFGKWGRPNYNSVVATFCYNIARDHPIEIHNASASLSLVYIDDLVNIIIAQMKIEYSDSVAFPDIEPVYQISVGTLAQEIKELEEKRSKFFICDFGNQFIKKLYSTYLSYLPEGQFGK